MSLDILGYSWRPLYRRYFGYLEAKRDLSREGLLCFAVKEGYEILVQNLVEAGSDMCDSDLLAIASEYGNTLIVQYLLTHTINCQAGYHRALWIASKHRHFEIMELLIKHITDTHAHDNFAREYEIKLESFKRDKHFEKMRIISLRVMICVVVMIVLSAITFEKMHIISLTVMICVVVMIVLSVITFD